MKTEQEKAHEAYYANDEGTSQLPQLNDWLRVVGMKLDGLGVVELNGTRYLWLEKGNFYLKFDLTTGQPMSEADYKSLKAILALPPEKHPRDRV